MMIADIHAHIFPDPLAQKASAAIGDFYNIPIHHISSLQELLEQKHSAGISVSAVSSSATSPEQAAHINDFIAHCIRGRDDLVGLGSLFPTMEDWEAELERMIAMGLRGVKIHSDFQKIPIDEPKAVDMYRGIAKAGLPVLFHMGDDRYDFSSPDRLAHLISQVPDLIVVAAHFGGYKAWDRACAQVLPENVFYDTSSSLMFLGRERALELMDKLGAHRFLFGTDFPMWTPGEELQRFLDLGLDEEICEQILYKNFRLLFPA